MIEQKTAIRLILLLSLLICLISSCSKKTEKVKIPDFNPDKIVRSEVYIDLKYPKTAIPLSSAERDLMTVFFKEKIYPSEPFKAAPFMSFCFYS